MLGAYFNRHLKTVISLSTCFIVILCSQWSVAQAPELRQPADVRMVIDISGSMKKNDPQNLRRPALEMLVKLLPKGSKAGVWTFGRGVQVLVPHDVVDQRWIDKASKASAQIRSNAQFTNIGSALEKSAYDLSYVNDEFQQHVILLTDGMVDINRSPAINKKERQRIIDKILPTYQKAGFTLHTIALSENADQQLMNKLALETDGKVAVAKNADELMSVFLSVFDQAVPSESLPLEGNSFIADSSIEEFTALIFRQPGAPQTQLVSPELKKYTQDNHGDDIKWHHTDKYDLITVQQPIEGEWVVIAEIEPQSRITVVSDLSLAVKGMPNNLQVGDSIATSLVLREDNETITRAEFLDLLDIDVAITADNGHRFSQRLSEGLVPGDGIYSIDMDEFPKAGEYKLSFTVDGKTFKRQYVHSVSVRQPFNIDTAAQTEDGQTQFTVTITPQVASLNYDKVDVLGKLKGPNGTSNIVNFKHEGEMWQLIIPAEQQGEYLLTVRVSAEDEKGKQFDFIPDTIRLLAGADKAVFETVAAPEKMSAKEEPVVEQPKEQLPEEQLAEESIEEEDGSFKIILYSVLALVNVLIIGVGYILYRKLFKKNDEDDEPEPEAVAEEPAEEEFEEPPMDEMAAEDLTEEIDLAEETVEEIAAPPPEVNTTTEDMLKDLDDSDIEESIATEPENVAESIADEVETPPEPPVEVADNEPEMVLDDLNTEEVAAENTPEQDPSEELSDEQVAALMDEEMPSVDEEPIASVSETDDDALAEMLNDEAEDDEEPEFSLDDFAPDKLDDDDLDEDDNKTA